MHLNATTSARGRSRFQAWFSLTSLASVHVLLVNVELFLVVLVWSDLRPAAKPLFCLNPHFLFTNIGATFFSETCRFRADRTTWICPDKSLSFFVFMLLFVSQMLSIALNCVCCFCTKCELCEKRWSPSFRSPQTVRGVIKKQCKTLKYIHESSCSSSFVHRVLLQAVFCGSDRDSAIASSLVINV